MNKTVYFLGEEYSVPTELNDFVKYLKKFDKIHEKLMPLLIDEMLKEEFSGGAEEDFAYYKKPLTECGREIIAELAENNIFDITLNDVVFDNKGYIKLHNVCVETMKQKVDILRNTMEEWLEGYERACNDADASVTGSGVSVWTNSITGALIYSALEASTVKQQTDKASEEYSKAMKTVSDNTTGKLDQKNKEVLVNTYYPGVAEALKLFVSEMMEIYLNKLDSAGKFDYIQVKKYNLKRSSDLLENISLVKDKAGLLKEAFLCCPYNPDIYLAALENNVIDEKTFETAKYFYQDDILSQAIEKYAIENIDEADFSNIRLSVRILSQFKNKTEKEVWKDILSEKYQNIKLYFTTINNIINKTESPNSWIKENISNNSIDLCHMETSEIESALRSGLFKKILTEEQFSIFDSLNILDNIFLFESVESFKDLFNLYYNALLPIIKKYIEALNVKMIDHQKKVEIAKETYEKAIEKFDKDLEDVLKEIDELKVQKSELGVFSVLKKKEIDTRLEKCIKRRRNLKNNNNLEELKGIYENLCDEMKSLSV